MSITSTGVGRSKWLRNVALAKYIGVSNMCLYRWKRDPSLNFPAATVVNGIEYNDIDAVNEWMKQRVVKRHGGK
jgi:predicted DNA-binding transcriptional regulator AlpA